jgi:branched-chain amino acid transport system substrate-binding protein
MKRRQSLQLLAGTALAPTSLLANLPATTEILLGQSAVLTGPLGSTIQDFNKGAELAFNEINRLGGVGARKIKLVSLDDELKPEKALTNYKQLIEEQQVFAMFGCVGTGTTAAVADYLKQKDMISFGGYAVGDSVRERVLGNAYMLRATNTRELQYLLEHLKTLSIKRVAVAALDNPGGKEVVDTAKSIADKLKLDYVGSVMLKADGSNSASTGKELADKQPQAVIMYLSGSLPVAMIEAMRKASSSAQIYGLSIVPGQLLGKLMGDSSKGITLAQVMPFPLNVSTPDPEIRQFQQLCEQSKINNSYIVFEGYVNARVLGRVLARVGRDLNRTQLTKTLRSYKERYMGMSIDFTDPKALSGSRFVELVQLGSQGRFIR